MIKPPKFLQAILGTETENEGFVDYDESYDTSSSAVTNEEAGYSSDYSSGYTSGYSSGYGASSTTNYSSTASSRAINIHGGAGQPRISVMKPTCWEDVYDALPILEEGGILILNLTLLDHDLAKRIVDFLTGVAAALHGRFETIDDCRSFAIASKNVEWLHTIEE